MRCNWSRGAWTLNYLRNNSMLLIYFNNHTYPVKFTRISFLYSYNINGIKCFHLVTSVISNHVADIVLNLFPWIIMIELYFTNYIYIAGIRRLESVYIFMIYLVTDLAVRYSESLVKDCLSALGLAWGFLPSHSLCGQHNFYHWEICPFILSVRYVLKRIFPP